MYVIYDIFVVGNKSDLFQQRQITAEEAKSYAEENGLLFFETSAKTAFNVTELFTEIGMLILCIHVCTLLCIIFILGLYRCMLFYQRHDSCPANVLDMLDKPLLIRHVSSCSNVFHYLQLLCLYRHFM